MRAPQITNAILDALGKARYDFVRLNYANGDMVGHTGNLQATIEAVEVVDRELGRLEQLVLDTRGALVVTADHGNADDMAERDPKTGLALRDQSGALVPRTSHSLNPVPFHVVLHPEDTRRFVLASVPEPGLGNVAATLATLMGFAPPENFLPSLLRSV